MSEFQLLILTVLSISAVHTFSGPDHYLPFIVLSRSKKWTLNKTLFWTSLCGIAHVLSSVLLGVIGIFLGWSIKQTFHIEEIRGGFAAWMLLGFGILYLLYAVYTSIKTRYTSILMLPMRAKFMFLNTNTVKTLHQTRNTK